MDEESQHFSHPVHNTFLCVYNMIFMHNFLHVLNFEGSRKLLGAADVASRETDDDVSKARRSYTGK